MNYAPQLNIIQPLKTMYSYVTNLRGLHNIMLSEKKVKEEICII